MFCQGDNISHNIPYTVRLRIFCKQSQFSKMRVCSFKWCNKNNKLNKGTSFFYYPKCADMARVWKELSGYERHSKYAYYIKWVTTPWTYSAKPIKSWPILYSNLYTYLQCFTIKKRTKTSWTDSIILIYIEHEIYIIS